LDELKEYHFSNRKTSHKMYLTSICFYLVSWQLGCEAGVVRECLGRGARNLIFGKGAFNLNIVFECHQVVVGHHAGQRLVYIGGE